jgi:two-component system chemotaxis response regulator CheB
MQTRQIVVIGTSAGGIEALRQLVSDLPRDFPAAIAVTMHISAQSPSVLHDILSRSGPLPVLSPRDNERLQAGHIFVAPPGYHLVVEPGRLRVTKGPKENRFRPAIDPLFRSAAQVFGPNAIGVILTGNLDDGTAGLWAVKQLGGVAIVQDPADALFPSMPQSALDNVNVDHCVPLADIVPLLVRLTSAAAPEPVGVNAPEQMEIEVRIAKEKDPLGAGVERLGDPSTYACPECHGVLRQLGASASAVTPGTPIRRTASSRKRGIPSRWRCGTPSARCR